MGILVPFNLMLDLVRCSEYPFFPSQNPSCDRNTFYGADGAEREASRLTEIIENMENTIKAMFWCSVQRCIRDSIPVAIGSAIAATSFNNELQLCMREKRLTVMGLWAKAAVYGCSSGCMTQDFLSHSCT